MFHLPIIPHDTHSKLSQLHIRPPRHGHQTSLVLPWLLINHGPHPNLQILHTRSQGPRHTTDTLLAPIHARMSQHGNPQGRRSQTITLIKRSRHTHTPANIRANAQHGAPRTQAHTLAARGAAGGEAEVAGVEGRAVDIVGAVQMHQRLGDICADMEDRTCTSKELHKMGILGRWGLRDE